ncbi:glycohydrolase toxin TNT-related protein [Mycolicibacterium sp. 3033]|nr:glycohydrolase toxin TNT-related protein [Mycolicibacterium aurantiacum]
MPGGAGPGTPGAGPAPGGSTPPGGGPRTGEPSGGGPSGGGPSGGGPRVGEPSSPGGRPSGSGAEGGTGPRAPVDAGSAPASAPQPTAGPGITSEPQGDVNGRTGGQPNGSTDLAPEARGESIEHGGDNNFGHHTDANAEHANGGNDSAGDHHHGGPDHQSPGGPDGYWEPKLASEVFADADPFGHLTKEQFDQQFVDDRGWFRYPDDTDPAKPYAIPGTVRELDGELLQTQLDGARLDRIGHPGGAWLAPEGTPYGERALPPDSLQKPYHIYVVRAENPLPAGWTIEQSKATPWFGQSGGGLQYRVLAPTGESGSIEELLDSGFLSEVFE